MKKSLLLLFTAGLLSAVDVTQNIESIASPPEFTGGCNDVVSFALKQKPQLLSDQYFIGSAVDLGQDMKVSWQINSGGSFDGGGVIGKSTTSANCLKPELIEDQVKEKVDYYRQLLANKTNPLIDQIGATAAKDVGKSTSEKYVEDFTLKGDAKSADGFFGGFLQEIREPYQAAQTYIVLFFIVISLVSLGADWIFFNFGKLAKETNAGKVSTIEAFHRFAIGIPLLLIFYSNSGITTRAQDIFAAWVGEGSHLADALANKVHVSNAKYTVREIASTNGITANELEKKVRGKLLLEQKAIVDGEILASCFETYDINALKEVRRGKSDLIFPASPAEVGKTQWDFEQYYINNKGINQVTEDDLSPARYFSINSCAAAESSLRNYVKQAPALEKYFTQLENFDPEKLKYVVSGSMSKNITMGWTSIAMLPAQQAMQSQTSMLDTQVDKSGFDNVEFDFSADGFEKLYNSYENFSFSREIEGMSQRAAFLFVPGATGIYSTFNGVMEGLTTTAAAPAEITASAADKAVNSVSTAVGSIPVIGGLLSAGVSIVGGTAVGGVMKMIQIGKVVLKTIPPYYIATEAARIMVDSLVFVIPMLVAAVVITWWYVEVFAYMIMIPFAAAFAFGENAKANILQFIIKGVGLAFKPMLIVLSVFLAVKAAGMLEAITTGMISAQELAMVSQANAIYDHTQWSVTSPLAGWGQWIGSVMRAGLIQGVLFIAVAITKVFLISGIILKLPSFMLGLLNINADSNGGEAIASKISTVTKGI